MGRSPADHALGAAGKGAEQGQAGGEKQTPVAAEERLSRGVDGSAVVGNDGQGERVKDPVSGVSFSVAERTDSPEFIK